MTSPTPTHPSEFPTDLSAQPAAGEKATRADALFPLLQALVLLAIIGYLLWFDARVPVSAEDIKDSSWLGGMWSLHSFVMTQGTAMALTCLVMGALIGFAKRSALTMLTGLLMATVLHLGTSETAQFRLGAAVGTARIGCYVWDSKECRSMLGIQAGGAPSMYLSPEEQAHTGKLFTDWYENKLEAVEFPGGFGEAGHNLVSPDALNATLLEQRRAVARFRKSGGISH